jgi:hypothetical protein
MLSAPAIPDDFDWSSNNTDVAVRRQDAVAVYENVNGDVVVRRQADFNEDEDPILIINKACVPALVRALIDTAGLEAEPVSHGILLPPPARSGSDPTAAERQRRYRDRHRNGADRNAHDRNDRYGGPLRHAETLDLEVPATAAS